MRSLDVDECAAYLKVDRTTVLKLAAEGVLPGAKIGRSWVFPEALLVDYLTTEVRKQQAQRKQSGAVDQMIEDSILRGRSEPAQIVKRRRGQRLPSVLGTLPEPASEF